MALAIASGRALVLSPPSQDRIISATWIVSEFHLSANRPPRPGASYAREVFDSKLPFSRNTGGSSKAGAMVILLIRSTPL